MIRIDGPYFKDEQGRRLLLRGVNLGGSSKVPYRPDGATYSAEGFFDHRNVSFTGRPFPLEEAEEHFSRLKSWGLDFLRFLVTWEAVEHAGPGIYDEEYLDYLYRVVKKAADYKITLFIDPHQDVWSRFSGGDGAPGWTLEAVGLDMTKFAETGAAIVHNTHGDPFPRMIWPTNYTKLAAATMFTLFFGGNDFAPLVKIDGEPVQGFLQDRYIGAVKQVALRLKGLPNVAGYDLMNELSGGYIGWPDLGRLRGLYRNGLTPTPFQSMALGDGFPGRVEEWGLGPTGFGKRGTALVNRRGVRAWRDGFNCIWREHGVWDTDASGRPILRRPDYFARINGRAVDFSNDYLKPFISRFTREIRSVSPGAFIFIEHEVGDKPPQFAAGETSGMVYAAHWYDAATLFLKKLVRFLAVDADAGKLVLGPKRIRESFNRQLKNLKERGEKYLCGAPSLVGEVGIPYDLNSKKAFSTGDFTAQIKAMDRSLRALEANLLSFTIWNYTAANNNARGDLWNDEDLSIFSRDQQADPSDLNSGGRALEAVIRPYARKTAGEPLRISFDLYRGDFAFTFRHDPGAAAPTEIFIPAYQYPEGCRVEVSDGTYELERAAQTLYYYHDDTVEIHTIRVARCRGA